MIDKIKGRLLGDRPLARKHQLICLISVPFRLWFLSCHSFDALRQTSECALSWLSSSCRNLENVHIIFFVAFAVQQKLGVKWLVQSNIRGHQVLQYLLCWNLSFSCTIRHGKNYFVLHLFFFSLFFPLFLFFSFPDSCVSLPIRKQGQGIHEISWREWCEVSWSWKHAAHLTCGGVSWWPICLACPQISLANYQRIH